MNITSVIQTLREEYIENAWAVNFYEINNGLCEDFALECLAILGGYDTENTQYELQNECFMSGLAGEETGDDVWDRHLLEIKWGIAPPCGLTWDDLNQIHFGRHVWLYYKGLHYDAECSEGVKNFFELPLFKRYIYRYKGEHKEIETN